MCSSDLCGQGCATGRFLHAPVGIALGCLLALLRRVVTFQPVDLVSTAPDMRTGARERLTGDPAPASQKQPLKCKAQGSRLKKKRTRESPHSPQARLFGRWVPGGPSFLSPRPFLSPVIGMDHEVTGDFPGGPVGRTQHFHCRGPRFDPWLGN